MSDPRIEVQMKRVSQKRSISVGLLLVVLSIVHSGYVIQTLDNAQFTHQFWSTGDFPLRFHFWEGFTADLPQIIDGSSPRVAIKEVMERWVRATSLSVVLGPDSSTSDAGLDDTNLITVPSPPANNDLISQSGGALGLSVRFAEPDSGRIVEADVIFNPAAVWSTLETSDSSVDNLFDVALHEFGHHWNLKHSISRSSTMFFQTSGVGPAFNPLAWDDVAGRNVT